MCGVHGTSSDERPAVEQLKRLQGSKEPGSAERIRKVKAGKEALEELVRDSRKRHEQLQDEFERTHLSPHTSPRRESTASWDATPTAPAQHAVPAAGVPAGGVATPIASSASAGGLGILLSDEHNGPCLLGACAADAMMACCPGCVAPCVALCCASVRHLLSTFGCILLRCPPPMLTCVA